MRGVLAVYRKELRQIARDRRTLMILAFIPAFFLLLYGYALNFDIRNIELAVEDRDGTVESRAWNMRVALAACPPARTTGPLATASRIRAVGTRLFMTGDSTPAPLVAAHLGRRRHRIPLR